MKISNFVYGMIISVGIFTVFFIFAADTLLNYGVTIPEQYNTTFTKLSNMSAMDDQTLAIKEATLREDANATSGFFGRLEVLSDILGIYYSRGYQAVTLVPNTVDVALDMSNSVLDTNNLWGTAGPALRFIVTSLIIVAVMFLIISILVKWWV